MTEQEKRDDLVLEMAQQLCEYAGIGCQDCPKSHSPEEYGECELPEICTTLADYVLRKEEEVQKETAEVFSNRIKSLILEFYGAKDLEDLVHKDPYGIIHRDYIWKGLRRLEKEFGVEVEE